MARPPQNSSSLEGEDGTHKRPRVPTSDSSNLVMPEDGHEWKKYGQKYIKKIKKNRSYFHCRKIDCGVKKKVDWPPSDPNNMRIVYEGAHNHPARTTSSDQEASSSAPPAPNPYDLTYQVFGNQSCDQHL